jgi:hypothetical protein
MPRTIVDIPESQLRDLDARCGILGISRAEAVRRAVDEFLRGADQGGRDAFGLWRQGSKARDYRKELRKRW